MSELAFCYESIQRPVHGGLGRFPTRRGRKASKGVEGVRGHRSFRINSRMDDCTVHGPKPLLVLMLRTSSLQNEHQESLVPCILVGSGRMCGKKAL